MRQLSGRKWRDGHMRTHFLFNTLISIRELQNSNSALTSAGLENLSGYLWKNLDALALNRMISFTQELKRIEQYCSAGKAESAQPLKPITKEQVRTAPYNLRRPIRKGETPAERPHSGTSGTRGTDLLKLRSCKFATF